MSMTEDEAAAASDPELAAAEAELAQAQKDLAWEMSKAAVDAAGLVDPTPISDGIGAAMSLADGDLVGAGLSLVSMVPYVGDAIGKTAKGARALKKLNDLRKLVTALLAKVEMLRKAAKLAAKGLGKAAKAGDKVKTAAHAAEEAVDIGMKHLSDKAKAILKCPAKQEMIEKAVKHGGINRSTAARLMEVAEDEKVLIRMRPTNQDALDWINKGHPPKPEALKMKTINETDELIGAPKHSKGLVGYFEPKPPDPKLKETNPTLYEDAMKRYKQRRKEFADYQDDIDELVSKGEVRVEDGVVVQASSGKGFTGDNDIFDIRNADGTPLSPEKYDAVLDKLKEPPVSAQHGAHMSWDTHGDPKKEAIFRDIVGSHADGAAGGGGKALAEFGPNGYQPSFADLGSLLGGK